MKGAKSCGCDVAVLTDELAVLDLFGAEQVGIDVLVGCEQGLLCFEEVFLFHNYGIKALFVIEGGEEFDLFLSIFN